METEIAKFYYINNELLQIYGFVKHDKFYGTFYSHLIGYEDFIVVRLI